MSTLEQIDVFFERSDVANASESALAEVASQQLAQLRLADVDMRRRSSFSSASSSTSSTTTTTSTAQDARQPGSVAATGADHTVLVLHVGAFRALHMRAPPLPELAYISDAVERVPLCFCELFGSMHFGLDSNFPSAYSQPLLRMHWSDGGALLRITHPRSDRASMAVTATLDAGAVGDEAAHAFVCTRVALPDVENTLARFACTLETQTGMFVACVSTWRGRALIGDATTPDASTVFVIECAY